MEREAEWREGIGSRLAYASDGSAWVAGTARGLVVFEADAVAATASYPNGLLGEIAFAPGDRRVLAAPGIYDRDAGAWEPLADPYAALTGDLDPEAAMGFEIHAGAWDTRGETLAAYAEYRPERGIGTPSGYGGPTGRLALLDGESGALETMLWEGDPVAPHAAIVVAGDFVAAGGTAVGVWERPGGRPIAVLEGLGSVARTVRLSADGAFLSAGAAGGRVAVWRADTWEPRAIWDAHDDEAAAVAWHRDTLATGGGDGRVALWTAKGEQMAETAFEEGPVKGLAWRPDGTRLLAAIGGPDAAIVALRVAA